MARTNPSRCGAPGSSRATATCSRKHFSGTPGRLVVLRGMKHLTLTLAILTLLSLNAAAQDGPAPGDRVEITFASGGSVMGTVVAPPKGAPTGSLTLDLSSEYAGLQGTLTAPKHDI